MTGSRTWDDEAVIARDLELITALTDDTRPVLVHGWCPNGADEIALRWAISNGWWHEGHRARWDEYGRRAGRIRNGEMVDLGADVCLAYIRDRSSGASHCAGLAVGAGITTVIRRAT